jgi:hypothetical protein
MHELAGSLADAILVGDFVLRRTGRGDSQYGRVIAREEGSGNRWLVSAGGRIYRDCAADLHLLRRPWPVTFDDCVA